MPSQPVPSDGINNTRTRKPARLILAIVLVFVGCLAALLLASAYVYQHPSIAVPLVTKSIVAITGLEVTVEEMSYGLAPLHLHARRIVVSPTKGRYDFKLKFGSLDAQARMTGPFGRRTLTVEHLRIEGFDGSLSSAGRSAELLSAMVETGPPSRIGRLARLLVRYLLFSDITWSGAEMVDGRVMLTDEAWQMTSAGIEVKMTPQEGIDIRGQSLEGHYGHQSRFAASGYQLHLDPENPAVIGVMTGRLHISGSFFQTPRLVWRDGSVTAEMIYHAGRSEISLPSFNLEGHAVPLIVSPAANLPSRKVSFTTHGIWRVSEKSVELPEWSLTATDLLVASGHARIDTTPPYLLQLDLMDGRLENRELVDLYGAVMDGPHLPLNVSGVIKATGHAAGPLNGTINSWQGDLRLTLKKVPLVYGESGMRLTTDLSGNIIATGHLFDPQLKIDLDAEAFGFNGSGVSLTGFRPSLSAAGRFPVLEVALRTRGVGALMRSGDIRIEQVKVEWDKGRIDLQSFDLSLPRIALSTATLKNITASLTGNPGQTLLKVKGRKSGFTHTAASLGFLPAGWNFQTEDTLDLTVEWQSGNPVSLNGRMDLTDFRFTSPDENRIGETIQARVDTTARYSVKSGIVRTEINFSAAGGEVLWGRYYLDLGVNPLAATGIMAFDTTRRQLTIDRLTASLKEMVALNVAGSVQSTARRTSVDLIVKMAETNARNLYRHLVAEPYKFDRPSLSEVEIDGRINAEAALSGNINDLHAQGRAYWKKGRIDQGNGSLILAGIDLDLPLWFETIPGKKAGSSRQGHLTVADMKLPHLGQQPLRLEFEVGPNRMAIPRTTVLNAFSGQVVVGPVAASNLYTNRMVLETDLTFRNIDIDTLLKEVWPQIKGGTLAGRLDSVRLEGRRLLSNGQLTTRIFGGSIDIIDPGISGLMTSVPVLKFSSRINDLDLEQMTAGTGFGKIRGILQGSVEGLEIVDGQPQRFALRLETVEKKGVPQKINIRAVDNIARLGGGGSPFMGMAGSFAKIFRDFPYQKIGIAARLENDIFRVNGTIKENGTEYLVKKGGFSGVNVVNLNPDNRISFKDMIKRIKRISGSQGGPVIR